MHEGVSVHVLMCLVNAALERPRIKPGIPFNATPRADASNSESRSQNSLQRVPPLTFVLNRSILGSASAIDAGANAAE
jgi:hypothetical protein